MDSSPTIEAAGDARMRAVVQRRYGSADTWAVTEVDRPAIGADGVHGLAADEVLVEVRAAGLDRGTWHLMEGEPLVVRPMFGVRRPRSPIPGSDVAGVVVGIGASVSRFSVGDEVYGTGRGTFAEFCVAKQAKLSIKPVALSFEQAGATPVSGSTALQGLVDVGKIESGQRVLITGASGGVGSFAVQIAKACGAHVTGVASAAKLDFVRSLGADAAVAYDAPAHDPAQHNDNENSIDRQVQSNTDQPSADRAMSSNDRFADVAQYGPFDLILDIAGNPSLRQLRGVLTNTGTAVIVGGEGGGRILGITRQLRAVGLSPFISQRFAMFIASESHEYLDRLGEMIESGAVTPVVDGTYALDEAADAMRQLVNGAVRGKLVVVPSVEE